MQYFGRRQSNSNCNDKMSRWATSWHSISLLPQNITFFADNSFFGQNILTHYHKNFLLVKRIFIVFIMLYSYLPERCKIQIVKCWIRRKICVPEGDKELATVTSVELCTRGALKSEYFSCLVINVCAWILIQQRPWYVLIARWIEQLECAIPPTAAATRMIRHLQFIL